MLVLHIPCEGNKFSTEHFPPWAWLKMCAQCMSSHRNAPLHTAHSPSIRFPQYLLHTAARRDAGIDCRTLIPRPPRGPRPRRPPRPRDEDASPRSACGGMLLWLVVVVFSPSSVARTEFWRLFQKVKAQMVPRTVNGSCTGGDDVSMQNRP